MLDSISFSRMSPDVFYLFLCFLDISFDLESAGDESEHSEHNSRGNFERTNVTSVSSSNRSVESEFGIEWFGRMSNPLHSPEKVPFQVWYCFYSCLFDSLFKQKTGRIMFRVSISSGWKKTENPVLVARLRFRVLLSVDIERKSWSRNRHSSIRCPDKFISNFRLSYTRKRISETAWMMEHRCSLDDWKIRNYVHLYTLDSHSSGEVAENWIVQFRWIDARPFPKKKKVVEYGKVGGNSWSRKWNQ